MDAFNQEYSMAYKYGERARKIFKLSFLERNLSKAQKRAARICDDETFGKGVLVSVVATGRTAAQVYEGQS